MPPLALVQGGITVTRLNLPFSALNCADRERLVPLPQPVLGWRRPYDRRTRGGQGVPPSRPGGVSRLPIEGVGVVYPVARTGRAVGRRGRGERASVRAPISIRDPLARRGGRSAKRRPFAGSRQNEHRPRKGENGAPLRHRMLTHAIGRMGQWGQRSLETPNVTPLTNGRAPRTAPWPPRSQETPASAKSLAAPAPEHRGPRSGGS
jgi:hypothetical protein